MKPAETTDWTCPMCGEVIPVAIGVRSTKRGTVRVNLSPTALADPFAHAWRHEMEDDS